MTGLRDIPEKTYRIVDAGAGGTGQLEKYAGTDLSGVIVLEDKGGTDSRDGSAMTEELKARNLTALSPTPAALMIADTDEAATPYQAILGSTTSMPTVTITKQGGEAIREALAAANGADVTVTVTHSSTSNWATVPTTRRAGSARAPLTRSQRPPRPSTRPSSEPPIPPAPRPTSAME